jgi:hypothetical protein
VVSFQGRNAGLEFPKSIGQEVPLYYYKLKFAAAPDSTTKINEIRGVPAPPALSTYRFSEMFQNRLFLFNEYNGENNKAIYSLENAPDIFNGSDSGYLYFGDNNEITAAAVAYNVFGDTAVDQMIVTKKNETYRVSGDDPASWMVKRISSNVGCIAPLSMASVDASRSGESDIPMQVIIWQGDKGFYMTDGTAVVPISEDIDCYFNPNDARAIPTGRLSKTVGWYDPALRSYKALISSGVGQTYHNVELEYSLLNKEWTKIYRESGSASSLYPPEYSATYVKATSYASATRYPHCATDPSKALTGSASSVSWVSAAAPSIATNQRFHVDLGVGQIISRIYYENSHTFGGDTNQGIKAFTLWGSNEAGSFADTAYGTDTGWTQLTTSQATFDQHAAADAADPKYITVTTSSSYRYYALKISSSWGGANVGVRRIEFQNYADPLQSAFRVWDTNGAGYTYGGNMKGFVYRLENGQTFAGTNIAQYLHTKDLILDQQAPLFRKSTVKYLRTALKKKANAGTISISHYGDQVLTVNGTSNQVVPSAITIATAPYNTQSCAMGPFLYHSFKFTASACTAVDGMELIGLAIYAEPYTALR